MPTTPGAWYVVPGGWSIGVEFTFYAAFPLVASFVTSLTRAAWLLLGTLLAGAALNSLSWPALAKAYGPASADTFLYFWFPNQMSVFAAGVTLFFLLQRKQGPRSLLARHPGLIASASVVLGLSATYTTSAHWLTMQSAAPPVFLVVTLALMVFIMALAHAGPGLLVNPVIALMGRVSFSAYLLHFAVLTLLPTVPGVRAYAGLSGWSAVAAFPFAILVILIIVLGVSWCTYRMVELPMIGLGKALIRGRRMTAFPNAS